MAVAPTIVQVTDDIDLYTGIIADGGLTNDAAPTVRVSVAGATAGDVLQLYANGVALGTSVTLTAEQVERGEIDLQAARLANGAIALTAGLTGGDGSRATSDPYDLQVDTIGLSNRDVTAVYSDGGLVAKHTFTNDRTLVAETQLVTDGPYAVQAGDQVRFIIDGAYWGEPITLTAEDIARGALRVSAPELSYGAHWFRFDPIDAAGNSANSANYWPFTISERLAPEIVAVTDDVAPQTGDVPEAGFTNDTVLAVRLSLDDTLAQAGDRLILTARDAVSEVTLTAGHIQAGYVDLDTGTLSMSGTGREDWTRITSQVRYADGTTGPTDVHNVRLALREPLPPSFNWARDDAGAQTGDLSNGATTDDSTPTFVLNVDADPGGYWQPPPPPPSGSPGHPSPPPHISATHGAPIILYADGVEVGRALVQSSQVIITSTSLEPGTHTFTARAIDKAGNTSELSQPFTLTIAADGSTSPPASGSGQVYTSPGPGSTVVAGAGDDTLVASQGADVLTGGGGADAFVYKALPWNAGKITDFAVGTDRLDLSAIFQASGYTGSDPIADGRIRLDGDGTGGTKVFFDRDAPNSGDWPFQVTTLQNVSPHGLTWAHLSGDAGSAPPVAPTFGFAESTEWTGLEGSRAGGVGTITYTVQLSAPSQSDVTANWTVSPSGGPDSVSADDFGGQFPTGAVRIAAGATTATFTVSPYSDTTPEADETFTVTLTNLVGASAGRMTKPGVVINDDGAAPPPSSAGQVYTAPGPGSTVTGGAGDDTIVASQGADVLTGAGGADSFVFRALPWSAGKITDFVVGTDRLDLSAIFQASGYSGSDPIADGRLRLDSDGAGGTKVMFDRDAPNSGDWPFHVTTLQGVGPNGLTWSTLSGGGGANPPPSGSPTLGFSQGTFGGFEGSMAGGIGVIQFVVQLSAPAQQDVTAAWTVTPSGTNAASADDFGGAFPTGTVRIAAGATSAPIAVSARSDTVAEPDETFTLTLSNISGATGGATAAFGIIGNDDGAPPSDGQVYTSPRPGSTVTGGAGNDTIIASQGADVLAGAGGADSFAFKTLPWSAGKITDFTVGTDRLDLSAIFQSAGYSGSDPIADGRVTLQSDGAGGTKVFFDRDAPNAGDWPFQITTLEHVSASGLTWAQLSGGAASPPPSSGSEIRFTADAAAGTEGSSSESQFGLTIHRTDNQGPASVEWRLTPSGEHPVDAADFIGGMPVSGVVNFSGGEYVRYIVLSVNPDTTAEPDETFTVQLSNAQGGTLGRSTQVVTIRNDDGGQPPPAADGEVLTSDQYGDTLVGGAGNDTLNAGQGPDKLTGAGGADHFVFGQLPWVRGEITDFTPGEDLLDLSALAPAYAGSDPIGDGYLEFRGTSVVEVFVDPDGPGGDWPIAVTLLRGVAPGRLSAGDWVF
ncbi:Calx-beta domain-containing protein [Phenylobacterium sp.]|jgi:Ca2+-binding RTX toxin-like protein|uniref:Calx-beta domain-containing protein n=1 Tax=Phenylobacterium sp. TaxID=1871053 RepID=UPI003784174D